MTFTHSTTNQFKDYRFVHIYRSFSFILLLGDIFGIFIVLGTIFYLQHEKIIPTFYPSLYYLCPFIFITLYLADAYKFSSQIARLRNLLKIAIYFALIILAIILFFITSNSGDLNLFLNQKITLLNLSLFTTWAIFSRLIIIKWIRLQAKNSSWLILGTDNNAIEFFQKFISLNPYGNLAFITESEQENFNLVKPQSKYLGCLKDLPSLNQNNWSGIIVADDADLSKISYEQLVKIRLQGFQVHRLLDFYENLFYKIPSSLLKDSKLAFSKNFSILTDEISLKIKRIIDIILSIFLLLILSPLMFLVAIAIKLDSEGSIFYSQSRTGLNGNIFQVHKFRSMYQDAERQGIKWADERDSRITTVGHFIRLFRIDELPHIWNVIKGEMSLIGPRPERPEFDTKLKQVIPYYDLRYSVKPGITGWAQVMYPYGASVKDAYEKLSYDLYYIKNYSLWLEIEVFLRTIKVVFLGKGR